MKNRLFLAVSVLGLALTGCGRQQLALPADPVERAATCAVVAAASARTGQANVAAPLPMAKQGEIVHFALIAGSEEGGFSRERAAQVVQRMGQLGDSLTSAKWETLIAPCRDSFPAADPARTVQLPDDRLEAELGCYMLGDFLSKAMKMQGNVYEDELLSYGMLKKDLDPRIASGFARKGVSGTSEKAREMRNAALSDITQRGSPVPVLEQCRERFA